MTFHEVAEQIFNELKKFDYFNSSDYEDAVPIIKEQLISSGLMILSDDELMDLRMSGLTGEAVQDEYYKILSERENGNSKRIS